MGLVYLPTWMVDVHGFHVGTYTMTMDGMDTPNHPFKGLLQEVLGGHHRGARWAAVTRSTPRGGGHGPRRLKGSPPSLGPKGRQLNLKIIKSFEVT